MSAGNTDVRVVVHSRAYREIQEAVPVCQREPTKGGLIVEEWWQRRWRKEDRLERCLKVGLKDE